MFFFSFLALAEEFVAFAENSIVTEFLTGRGDRRLTSRKVNRDESDCYEFNHEKILIFLCKKKKSRVNLSMHASVYKTIQYSVSLDFRQEDFSRRFFSISSQRRVSGAGDRSKNIKLKRDVYKRSINV